MNGTSRGTGERITLHQKPKKGDRAATTTKSTYQSLNTPSFLSVGPFFRQSSGGTNLPGAFFKGRMSVVCIRTCTFVMKISNFYITRTKFTERLSFQLLSSK